MKKQLLILISILSITISASAQKQYKVNKSSGHLILNLPGAIVEGYNGNEVIFSKPSSKQEEVDQRAVGLKRITGGFTDNTGMDLDVTEKGNEIHVNSVGREINEVLSIKVPQNMKVSFTNNGIIYQKEVIFKNLKSEIEVSTSYNKIKLENNSGPMNIKSLNGDIDVVFSNDIKGPVSIVSVYGYIDVAVPTNIKANVELSTNYGKLYSAEGLKIVLDPAPTPTPNTKTSTSTATSGNGFQITTIGDATVAKVISDTNRFWGNNFGESIKGKINGGGADIILKSTNKNIYLRDK